MSLLDGLGARPSNGSQSLMGTGAIPQKANNMVGAMKQIAGLLSMRNESAKEVAMKLLGQSNPEMMGQLKAFLKQNGVTDEQLINAGLNNLV